MNDRSVEIGTVSARWSGRGRPDPARIARLVELALERLARTESIAVREADATGGPDNAESRLAERLAREVHRSLGGRG